MHTPILSAPIDSYFLKFIFILEENVKKKRIWNSANFDLTKRSYYDWLIENPDCAGWLKGQFYYNTI